MTTSNPYYQPRQRYVVDDEKERKRLKRKEIMSFAKWVLPLTVIGFSVVGIAGSVGDSSTPDELVFTFMNVLHGLAIGVPAGLVFGGILLSYMLVGYRSPPRSEDYCYRLYYKINDRIVPDNHKLMYKDVANAFKVPAVYAVVNLKDKTYSVRSESYEKFLNDCESVPTGFYDLLNDGELREWNKDIKVG